MSKSWLKNLNNLSLTWRLAKLSCNGQDGLYFCSAGAWIESLAHSKHLICYWGTFLVLAVWSRWPKAAHAAAKLGVLLLEVYASIPCDKCVFHKPGSLWFNTMKSTVWSITHVLKQRPWNTCTIHSFWGHSPPCSQKNKRIIPSQETDFRSSEARPPPVAREKGFTGKLHVGSDWHLLFPQPLIHLLTKTWMDSSVCSQHRTG